MNAIFQVKDFKRACGTCSLRELCLPYGIGEEDLGRLEHLVQRMPPVHRGDGKSLVARVSSDSKLNSKVFFSGHVSDKTLYDFYRSALAFVTMSEHEGFCVPVVEAMGLNLPVFGRASAAIPETLGRNQYLFGEDSRSLQEYAKTVFDVLGDAVIVQKLISKQAKVYGEIVERSSGEKILALIEAVLP